MKFVTGERIHDEEYQASLDFVLDSLLKCQYSAIKLHPISTTMVQISAIEAIFIFVEGI